MGSKSELRPSAVTTRGGVPSESKPGTSRLFIQTGRVHCVRARYEDANPLFQRVLLVAAVDESGHEISEACYWLENVSATQHKYAEAKAATSTILRSFLPNIQV